MMMDEAAVVMTEVIRGHKAAGLDVEFISSFSLGNIY